MAKYTRLSYAERKRIEQLKTQRLGVRDIAKALCRSTSTISTELRRCRGPYKAELAQRDADKRMQWRKPEPKISGALEQIILLLMVERRFSPEQISAYLSGIYSEYSEFQVCHETIYRWVYQHPERRTITTYLRQRHKQRRSRSTKPMRRGGIKNRVSIHDRPAEVESRQEVGHWEADLIIGEKNHSCMGTLVERTSRFTVLVKLDSKESETVVARFIAALQHFPPHLRKSLTYDNGTELSRHEELTRALQMPVYFADPRSPWQRGSNENTNGLIREFYPKGTDLSPYDYTHLAGVAALLNSRPRKVLGFATPQHVLEQHWPA